MRFDAVVIGAGPAGASAALALAKQGRSVAIVERSEFPRRKVCGEFMSAVNMPVLDSLGVGDQIRALAGPEVTQIALFASGPSIVAPMPRARGEAFGRALGRDVLDCVLLDAARAAGVTVFQPWRAVEIAQLGSASRVRIETRQSAETLIAPVIIAAHGSWEQGKLSSNLEKRHGANDFLGFKAHFKHASLLPNVMPLLAFPGGYGGMVWADSDRLSLSCCIRRDALDNVRSMHPAVPAAAAVHLHILSSCPAASDVIGGAFLEGEWLAAGPMRPGIRSRYHEDIFRVGNLAGESHPIIAEGISMALQSGWMLAQELSSTKSYDLPNRVAAGKRYSISWRSQFSTRIRVASFLAKLAISPFTATAMRTVVGAFPSTLSLGATLSGKTRSMAGFV